MPRYSQLSVDGVIGDIYDDAAVHNDELVTALVAALSNSTLKTAFLNVFYPIGTYYVSEGTNNPSTFLGGTWTKVEGKFLFGADSTHAVGSTGGSADAVVPTHSHMASGAIASAGAHTHAISATAAEAGEHYHTPGLDDKNYKFSLNKGTRSIDTVGNLGGSGYYISRVKKSDGNWSGIDKTDEAGKHTHSIVGSTVNAGAHTHTCTITVGDYGVSATGKNMPPYRAVNIWKRTA